MVEHGGKLYVFGGVDAAGAAQRSVFVYDPGTEAWSAGADMPTAREHLNAVAVGSFIHVLGGQNGGGAMAAHERYDPATDTWTTLAPLPTARSAAAAAALGGCIWVAGGEVPRLFAVNEVYDVASDRWCVDTPMALPRYGIAAVALDDRILAPAGGVVQGLQPTAATDVFVPGDAPVFPTAPACPAAPTACREPPARRAALALATRPPDAATRRGFAYVDRTASADGVQRVGLTAGADGKARIALVAKGAALDLPSLHGLTSPVTVQLRSATGAGFGARFAFPPALRQTATRFSDRSE